MSGRARAARQGVMRHEATEAAARAAPLRVRPLPCNAQRPEPRIAPLASVTRDRAPTARRHQTFVQDAFSYGQDTTAKRGRMRTGTNGRSAGHATGHGEHSRAKGEAPGRANFSGRSPNGSVVAPHVGPLQTTRRLASRRARKPATRWLEVTDAEEPRALESTGAGAFARDK